MDELEQAIRQATALGGSWTGGQVRIMLQCIGSRVIGAVCDWEQGNENWGTVAKPNESVAYVLAKMPLVLVQDHFADFVRDCAVQAGAVLLSVPDFGAKKFRVPQEFLQTVFGRPLTSVVNYDALSINDLWYATAT